MELTALSTFILLISFGLNFGLGLFVYLKDKRNERNVSFSFLVFCIALWILNILVLLSLRDPDYALFWARLIFVGPSLIPSIFLYFVSVFPYKEAVFSKWKAMSLFPLGILFAFLSLFSPLIVKSLIFRPDFPPFYWEPIWGMAHPIFTIYFIGGMGGGFYFLIRRYFREKQKREKLQLWYICLGLGIVTLIGTITNLIIPIFWDVRFATIGPSATLIFTGFVVYSIVSYHLLEIKDFLFRGIVFLGIVSAVAGTLAAILISKPILLLPFYTILANSALGLIVFAQDWKNPINRSFSFITLCVIIWVLAIAMYWEAQNPGIALFWSKIAFACTSFIPATLVYFSLIFPRTYKNPSLFLNFIIFSPIIIQQILVFSNQIVKGVTPTPLGYEVVPAQFYPVFTVYFMGYMGWAFWNLLRKILTSTGLTQIQIKYVFLAFFLGSIFPIFTNLILPMYGNTTLTKFGPSFTIIFVGITTYAIIRHRLMSIEIVIQKGMVYGGISMTVLVSYAAAVYFSEFIFRQTLGYSYFWLNAFAVLILAIAYHPLVRWFQWVTDQLFFKERYEVRKLLQELGTKITTMINLEEVVRLLTPAFIEKMKISQISLLLLDRHKEHFRSLEINLSRYRIIEISVSHPIIKFLEERKDILVKEEIESELLREGKAKKELEILSNSLQTLGTEAWIPIFSQGELKAALALGGKLSGEIFSAEDLSLLFLLGSQIAIALENASLYHEVVGMKEYSQEILESMVNGVITFDRKERITTFNYLAQKITGKRKEEVLGKTSEEIWGKKGIITTSLENAFAGKIVKGLETSLISEEKGLVPVALTFSLLHDSSARKIGTLLTLTDLTEKRELEDKVRRTDKLEALATMAAGMAHEIKNPLSSLKVFSQLLPSKFEDDHFRKKFQEIVPEDVNRIDRIVESLLSFAKATSPTFEQIKIDHLLEEILKDYSEQIKNAKIKVQKDYAFLPEIELDPLQMKQVFSNLILNALQVMPEGGVLTLKTEEGKKTEDLLQEVRIKIQDTGHGIPKELKEKLFDPFFTTKHGGTGLGLTISHSLISGHQGTITVESEVGKGSIFTVTLPVKQQTLPLMRWR